MQMKTKFSYVLFGTLSEICLSSFSDNIVYSIAVIVGYYGTPHL